MVSPVVGQVSECHEHSWCYNGGVGGEEDVVGGLEVDDWGEGALLTHRVRGQGAVGSIMQIDQTYSLLGSIVNAKLLAISFPSTNLCEVD